jgi:preprotein translocase subunit YajC
VNSFGFLILIVAFAFLWLVLVRPQKRRQVEQQRMISGLRVGDEVLTAGGIYGTIVRLDESEVAVEIAPGLEVRVARRAIAGVTPGPDEAHETEDAAEPEPAGGEPPIDGNPG